MKLKREAFGECIAEVAAQADVDEDTAFGLIQTVANAGERMRARGEPNPFDAAALDVAQKLKDAAALDRADALLNTMKRDEILQRVRDSGGLPAAELTLRSLLHGTNRGERDSVQAMWRGNAANWTGVLSNKLRAGGLEKAAISGTLDKEIAQALWSMNSGDSMPAGVSAPAKQIAEAIAPALDHVRDRLNGVGAHIGEALDYVAHTSHDPRAMRAAAGPGATPEQAFEAWWAKTEPRLNGEKTFENVTPQGGGSVEDARKGFGRSVYYALVSGVHKTMRGAEGVDAAADARVPVAYEGTSNLARRVSQPRVLFWKDAGAWHDNMVDFGTPSSLTSGVMETLDSSARHLALMDKFGTNPAGNLNLVIRKIEEEYRPDLDGLKKFQGKVTGLHNVMGRLDGSLNIPANEMAANIGQGVRTWESISSLGGVGVTHFASIWPTVTSEMVHHGVSRLGTMGKLVEALLPGRGDAAHQEVLGDLGAYAAGLNRDMENRWQADDAVPGKISSIANTFMKYTGIHYVYDNAQRAIREMLASQLGRSTATAFGDLNIRLQNILDKYGLHQEDWDILRAAPDLPVSGGRAYMTPSVASRTDPVAIEALLRERGEIGNGATDEAVQRAVRRYQWGLADKLNSYYGDAAAHGVVTPGVQERAFVLGNTRPGSLGGELLRYLAQFKMWPLAALNQVIGREIWLATSKGDAAFNIGSLIGMTMAGGYLRMAINDAARGNPQRNPLDPHTMIAALAQGGGIGIIGDFLFGETNRMGGDLISTLAGPVVGDANQLFKTFTRFRGDASDEDPDVRAKAVQHAWPDILRFGVGKIPFANLIYLKGALDYMLFYHLYESASPGWWSRSNARVEKETGRVMQGYSPGGGVPYGVPGVYLTGAGGSLATGLLAPQPSQ